MGLLPLLVLAVLALEPGAASGAETVGNSSEGLLEFSVGKFRYFKLNRPFPEEAILRHVSSNVTFLIFQLHSQYQNTTISFSEMLLPNASGTGTDKGLVFILRPEQSMCTWHLETLDSKPVQNVAIPLSYSERDPVPGGCNLEFDLDIDPNIYLQYNFFETTIKFAPANLGYARGTAPPPCDIETGQDSRWRLQYDVYQYFMPENDLTEEALLRHLQRMAEVPQVKANAVKVVTLTADDKTIVSFSSLWGQGVIYNVIVRDPFLNTSAAYVPVHTYACSFEAEEGNCFSLGRVSTKVFFTLFALLGLFICFFGHRFWKTELFFIGFILMGFFFYILITRLTPIKYDVRLILTALAGSIGGICLVAAWWRFGILVLCMLCVGLVLGFLISSVTFFTPLGNLKIFRDDAVFWVTFSCIAVLIPVVFMGCLRILNILTCGFIGSYSVVLAIDSYLYTSLSYITLNVLKRALHVDFRRAFVNVPFQTNDFIVLAAWGMLAVSGITLQIRRERGQPFFPPHPYMLWKRERERRVTTRVGGGWACWPPFALPGKAGSAGPPRLFPALLSWSLVPRPDMVGGRRGTLLAALLAAWVAAAAAEAEAGSEQAAVPEERSLVRPMTASNWTLVLEGEWMLKFYAPWCPSCQQTDSEWETFAKNGEILQISVGKVDVIQEPGLSGRFFVTTLPAFFHAKDGIFRRYRGPGIYEDLQNYILEKKWQSVEPLTGWKSPASLTMSGMAGLFSISGKIWHLHNYFTVTLGVPAWCSYVFFIIATLIFGLFMGLVLVVISECFSMPLPRHLSERSEQSLRSEEAHTAEQLQDVEEEKDDSNEEENKDSLVDDEEEKEDLGEEDEAEEDEEDSAVTGRDEERSDALDQRPPGEAPEDEAPGGETGDNTPEQPSLAGAEVAAEDTLRQRKSQHPDKGDKGDEGDEGPSA